MSDIRPSPTDPTQTPVEAIPGVNGGRRFLCSFFLASAGMYAVFQGMQQILLPSQVAGLDPDGKVISYGILASAGALAAAVGNPTFGSLSDRTRTRLGRRVPWLLASSTVAVTLLAILGGLSSLFWLGAAYILVMLTMSAFQATLSALVPDRVAPKRRGLAASVASVSLAVGVTYGINVAPVFVSHPTAGYLVLGSLMLVGTVTLAILTRDPTTDADERGMQGTSSSGSIFSALRAHDYSWAFGARVSFMLGHWTISTYQLYTVTDYIGVANLPRIDPPTAVAILASIKLGIVVITALIAGPLSDRVGRRKVFVVVGALGVAASICIPILSPTWAGMVAYSVGAGFFYGIFQSVDHALMTLVLPSEANAARDLGLMNVATTGPQIAGPFLAALIITATGGYEWLFLVAALTAALSAVLVLPIRTVR